MRIDQATRHAAAVTAQLALAFGSPDAAAEALAAAAARQDQVTTRRIITQARLAAAEFDASEDTWRALRWFADRLTRDLGMDDAPSRYTPGDGDAVQVTLTGTVTVYAAPRSGYEYEFATAEGIVIPLAPADFAALGVIRLLAGDEEP